MRLRRAGRAERDRASSPIQDHLRRTVLRRGPNGEPGSGAGAGERLEFFRPAALPGTEMMAAYESGRPWHVFHERYALCICHRAAAVMRYRGRDDRLTDGSVVVWEPGETHCLDCAKRPAEFKVLHVEERLVAEAVRELGQGAAPRFPLIVPTRDPMLFQTLDGLCRAIEGNAGALEQQTRFVATIAAFLRHARTATPPPLPARRGVGVEVAKAYLRERFDAAVSLAELTAVSGMSRFHLVHAFTREVGLAPHAYHIHVRIERAGALLRMGMPAAGVALSMGFADQSHFTRHFKQVMHVPPGAYARCAAAARSF